MNILITGASGYLGGSLVPYLLKQGYSILLVSRSKFTGAHQFRGVDLITYDELFSPSFNTSFECCIHLAVLNNSNVTLGYEDFHEVNVTLGIRILDFCINNDVKQFIYFGSVHEFDPRNVSFYSRTKRRFSFLSQEYANHIAVLNICIPAVYDLNCLPKRLQKISYFSSSIKKKIVNFIKIFWPLCSAERLCRSVEVMVRGDFASGIYYCADNQDDNLMYAYAKKVLDITGSLLAILFLWWLFLLTWVVIKVDTGGASVLRQVRVGKKKSLFTCYKFRTMRADAPVVGTHDVGDSYVTRSGKFLRKYKIDELPQVLNVLRGEMSFVGPRPCLPIQKAVIDERDRKGVYRVVPGITGYSQVRGVDMSNPVTLAESDSFYVANRTMALDLKILFRTIFRGKHIL